MPKLSNLPVSIRKHTGGSVDVGNHVAQTEPRSRATNAGHFRPGKSGNPRGRPAGTENVNHLRLRELLFNDAEAVLRRVVDEAIGGNMLAARLVLDRALPRRACRPAMDNVVLSLDTAADASVTLARIAGLAIEGAISTAEAADMARVIEVFSNTLAFAELSAKVELLEAQMHEAQQ
ncbi:MAG: DUF5681 domain-containing protein [Acidobacteriota bacterium]|nr:DUF5681 domain-containing protein [Acidobacteriota bacterium]